MQGNGGGNYRYLLRRAWDERPCLLWVMLNPSTANATDNDPTLKRCMNFSQRWGYGGLEIVNLFAYRTPYPKELKALPIAANAVGGENDRYVAEAAARAPAVVVAWGAWGAKNAYFRQRARDVLMLLAQHSDQQLLCLGKTRKGCPLHPLYVAIETKLEDFV